MKSTNDTRSKVFRWVLLLLNGFLTIGMFHIWYGCDNSRHLMSFWVDIPDYAYYYDLKSYQKISGICLGFSTVALIFVPLLHVFKLIGVLGEKLRNSRVVSCLFSVIEILGALAMPVSYIVVIRKAFPDVTFKEAFGPVTGWAIIWLELTVVALILSALLKPTEPFFDEDVEGPSVHSLAWYCPKCGLVNTLKDLRCRSCKTNRPKDS